MTAAVALPRRRPPDPHLVQRCLLLAMLLHVWLVLVFGNATGTAEPGQGVWGSLTVRLLGRSGGSPGAPPGEAPEAGAPAQSPSRSRTAEPSADAAPAGAAAPSPEGASADDGPPSTATLQLPEGFRPIERQDVPRSAITTVQTPAVELPPAVTRLETRPEAVTPLAPAASLRSPSRSANEIPSPQADLPAPVNRLEAAPAALQALPRSAELRALPPPVSPAPAGAELPPPVSRLESSPSPAAAVLQRQTDLRALPAPAAPTLPGAEVPPAVSRLETPADTGSAVPLTRASDLRTAPQAATAGQALPGTALPPTVQRLEAPTSESAGTTVPLNRASDLRNPATGATATVPNGQDLPAAVRRLDANDNAGAVTSLRSTANPRAALATPGGAAMPELSTALPGQVAAPAGPARGDPNASAVDLYGTSKGTAGTDAAPRIGPNVPAPPTAAASAARPALNLSLPRGDMTARRSGGLIDVVPPPPERKSRLEQSIEDAANKDCRNAYANTGLLAVVPLAIDAARGKGCKW